MQRIGTDEHGKIEIVHRGNRVPSSSMLLSRFRSGALDWDNSAEVKFELVLSGEKLVDNIDFRDQLKCSFPEAMGGEMEETGLFSAAYRQKIVWIIDKSICDWADGKKRVNKKARQRKASDNSADFIFHVLAQGGLAPSPIIL